MDSDSCSISAHQEAIANADAGSFFSTILSELRSASFSAKTLSDQVETLSAEVHHLQSLTGKLIAENAALREVLSASPITRPNEFDPACTASHERQVAYGAATIENGDRRYRDALVDEASWSRAASQLDHAGNRMTLGNSALLPFYEVLLACGISRDVGDSLREKRVLEPVVVNDSKNPRLYVTLGAWRDFVKKCKPAPPPSQSKLSRAKRAQKKKKA